MYCNQTALWNPVVSSVNSYGDVQRGSGVSIPVRRQEHIEEVRLKDGTIHKTKYIYYTLSNVNEDDLLDGNLVVSVYDMRTLSGKRRLRRLLTV